jgi:hypothetical protein
VIALPSFATTLHTRVNSVSLMPIERGTYFQLS